MNQAVLSQGHACSFVLKFSLRPQWRLILIENQIKSGYNKNLRLKLPPHHLIYNPRFRLNNLHHLRRILVNIIDTGMTAVKKQPLSRVSVHLVEGQIWSVKTSLFIIKKIIATKLYYDIR